jgi:hypothetical protein
MAGRAESPTLLGRAVTALSSHRKKLILAGLLVLAPLAAHGVVVSATRIEPPPITLTPLNEPQPHATVPGLRVMGAGYARRRGAITEVRLVGSPEAIGSQHGRLLYREMVDDEGALYGQFRRFVPLAPARALLMDFARLKFRRVDEGMDPSRRREIAAQALAFSPDPFDDVLPTYHRFAFLQALYDISLSFEHSPLLGCTSFALTDGAFHDGHAVLARNFDFEAGPVFDVGKVVFLVREEGRVPYASVAWPGLVGVVTGMNAEGLAVVVHGGRAREPRTVGEPVVQTMREVLGRARSTAEALSLLEAREPMVSHLAMLLDASGDAAVVERAPGAPMFVRRGRGKVPLTNHFEGPLARDPANLRIEATTSTWSRRRRLDELLSNLSGDASVERVVEILRDKRAPSGVDVPLGSRRAIDALIATHSVVMDATARNLWVSEGPHLVGRYVRFNLAELLDPSYEPTSEPTIEAIGADPIQDDGRYDAWVRAGSPHSGENE